MIIFQVEYFVQIHILAVFLVLGVGADDVFVLVDAWKQSVVAVRYTKFEEIRYCS